MLCMLIRADLIQYEEKQAVDSLGLFASRDLLASFFMQACLPYHGQALFIVPCISHPALPHQPPCRPIPAEKPRNLGSLTRLTVGAFRLRSSALEHITDAAVWKK